MPTKPRGRWKCRKPWVQPKIGIRERVPSPFATKVGQSFYFRNIENLISCMALLPTFRRREGVFSFSFFFSFLYWSAINTLIHYLCRLTQLSTAFCWIFFYLKPSEYYVKASFQIRVLYYEERHGSSHQQAADFFIFQFSQISYFRVTTFLLVFFSAFIAYSRNKPSHEYPKFILKLFIICIQAEMYAICFLNVRWKTA